MTPFILPEKARVVRRVSISPAAFTVLDAQEPWFSSYLAPPRRGEDESAKDESPRLRPHPYLMFAPPPLGPTQNAPLNPGERIETRGATYECLGRPRELRSGRRVVGMQVSVMPVTTLYPWEVQLQENGGAVVIASLKVAMWGTSEIVTSQGGYEDLEAEASVEYHAALKPNRLIILGGVRHHITRAFVSPDAPRVRMILRRRDRNG